MPDDVCSIQVFAVGAAGGDGEDVGEGAFGAKASATVPVTPGETLEVVVGGAGETPEP